VIARSSLWTLYSAAWFSCNFYDSSSEALYNVGNASYCISDLHDLMYVPIAHYTAFRCLHQSMTMYHIVYRQLIVEFNYITCTCCFLCRVLHADF